MLRQMWPVLYSVPLYQRQYNEQECVCSVMWHSPWPQILVTSSTKVIVVYVTCHLQVGGNPATLFQVVGWLGVHAFSFRDPGQRVAPTWDLPFLRKGQEQWEPNGSREPEDLAFEYGLHASTHTPLAQSVRWEVPRRARSEQAEHEWCSTNTICLPLWFQYIPGGVRNPSEISYWIVAVTHSKEE